MRVSETSCSLLNGGGSSTVYPFVEPRIVSRYYWNYFRQHSYHEQGRGRHRFAYTTKPRHASRNLSQTEWLDIYCHATWNRIPLRLTIAIGRLISLNSVADEANDVANDVASDVANEDRRIRQHQAAWGAIEGTSRSCQHLNTVQAHRCRSTTMISKAKV